MQLFINILNKIYNVVSSAIMIIYCWSFGISVGKNVLFKGFCSILKVKSAEISIGNGTIINSNNYGYHLNMFARCKLLADRKGATIIIGEDCRIHATCIHAYTTITIGNRVLIAANTQIIDGNGHLLSMDNPSNRINTSDQGKPICIEDDVWIGTGSIILGGVKIGQGAVIAANTLVNKDIPPKSLVMGNPMKLIKMYT